VTENDRTPLANPERWWAGCRVAVPPGGRSCHSACETPFHNALARRLTWIMAGARTKKASVDEGVAS
jgi:hypothetical protein